MKKLPRDIELEKLCAAIMPKPQTDEVEKGFMTSTQIAEKLQRPRNIVLKWLSEAVQDGRCEMKKFRVIAGNRGVYPTPHYRIIK